MKRFVVFAFVIFIFLLTASCASAPNWSGAETAAGELVFTQSPGIRFYINVLLLGAVIVLFVTGVIKDRNKKSDLGLDHIGCIGLIFLLVCFALWKNLAQNIWTESFSITSERIERIFYPSAGAPVKQTIEWKNVASCEYFSGQFDVTKWKMQVGGDRWEEGENRRGLALSDKNKMGVTVVVEIDEFNTNWRNFFNEWLFGSNDFRLSSEDEALLKKAVNNYLPENVRIKMSPETKEYLSN